MLDMSRKQGMSGPVLRGEAQMRGGVLKIHPTVQTKGGMKKGRGCRTEEKVSVGVVGKIFGVKRRL